MNINFGPVFLNDDGSFRQPEVIAESVLLIKDIGQAQGIKLALTDWLKENDRQVSFLPEIKAVHDHARETSGIGAGGEIREEDFLVLMERASVPGLKDKFRRPHFRNYKKSLLKLLNLLDLGSGELKDRAVLDDLENNGLVPEVLDGVKDFINRQGYYFKGQIFDKAVSEAGRAENIFYINFCAGEFSYQEKKFLKALEAQEIRNVTQGKYSGLADLFKGRPEVKFDPGSAEFYVSASKLDEIRKIKHFILKSVTEGGSGQKLNDFTVVCQNEEMYVLINNYLYAEGIPAYSSYKSAGNDINTDVLRLFKAGAEGDSQSILNFFNLYIAQKPLLFDDLTELDLKALISKLFGMKGSDYKLKASGNVKEFVKAFLKASLAENTVMSAEKALLKIKSKLMNLKEAFALIGKGLEADIYTYEETVKRIFGDTEKKFTDYVDYLYLIATKTNAERLNKDINGVRIMMLGEPVPAGKILIFSGMTEDVFLKATNPVKIVGKDNYFSLYESVYGLNPEEALFSSLSIITSGETKRLAFFIPQWGEEFIPSTRLDRILSLYPKKKMKIEVVPKSKGVPELSADFSVTLEDKLKEKNFGRLSITRNMPKPEPVEIGISLNEGSIAEFLVSASKIESFMSCPAAHVHDLNMNYDSIEPQFPFVKGNFYHKVTEKFLKYFKGGDLLNETEYAQVLSGLSGNKTKEDISRSRFGEFPEYLLYGIQSEKYGEPFKILAGKIMSSDIISLIDSELSIQEDNDPYSYYARKKQKSEITGFLAWLMIELGPTPSPVTSTFETEVKFSDFDIASEPEISIKRGYIDFLYIDNSGTVRIIDIKSNRKFSKFEEEIEKYQKVQILLYREAISRHIKGEPGVNLFPEKEEDKTQDKECTILDQSYFGKVNKDAPVEAVYFSPNTPYRLPVDGQIYEEFINKLKKKLGAEGKFTAQACSKCEYCPLSQSCPEYEDIKFEKIEHITPEPDAASQNLVLERNKNPDSKPEETKKFIIFEDDKEKALTSKGNIIISAGAGAGKTEVLSSKYINLLINTEADLNNIVCITFTKKAAGEMQKRIYSKLNDILESGYFFAVYKGADPNSYKITSAQKEKLLKVKEDFYDKNLISTFHSFCNKFITEYGYSSQDLQAFDIAMDLSEDFTVGEEAVKFLKDRFAGSYKGILDTELSGEETNIFAGWLESRHLIYSGDQEGGFIPDILKLYDEIKLSGRGFEQNGWVKPVDEYLRTVEERIKTKFGGYFELRDQIISLIDSENDEKLSAIGEKIRNYKTFSYKRDTKKYPEIFSAAEALSESEGYKIFNEKNVDLSLNGAEWIIKKALFLIVKALDDHIKNFKREKGLLEQSDLHLHFLQMLDDDELKNKLQNGFGYILVDEFQDTNWLQDKILGALTGSKNRFFFVGDKKQSIYRFQQCDVQIFEKYERSEDFKTLYFSQNYRSVPHIVKFNNKVFEPGASNGYDIIGTEDELLEPVRKDNIYPVSVNFINICTEKAKKDNPDATRNETGRLSKMCEAAFVADTIIESAKTGKKFCSWAVLIRKYTHIGYITEAFRKKSVPYTLILKKDLFGLDEVKEFILILKAVMGAAAPEEIEFVPQYKEMLSSFKKGDPLLSLIFSISDNGIYRRYLASFDDYKTKAGNIDILKETLISFLDKFDNDRERFLTVLDKSIKANSAGVEVKDPEAVTIMTVHSAKGLEFDDLIIANVDENSGNFSSLFNYLNLCEGGDCFTDFSMTGYSTPGGKEKRNFFVNEYIKYMNRSFDDHERANLLYVALTRAKNSLTVVIQTKDESGDSDKNEGWAKYLRKFGSENGSSIEGFGFTQKDISSFDLSGYFEKAGSGPKTYEAEIEYDLTGLVRTDGMTSATGIAHKEDDITHEKGSTAAIDTGNFVHLFMSRKIGKIYAPDFDLDAELKEFRKKESDPSSVSPATAKKMITNIISDPLFRKYAECGRILCEKNIVMADKNIQGYIDLVLLCGDEVIVLDYKTYLYSFPADELIGKYKTQIDIYADALGKIYPDKNIRKYLFFIGRDKAELREIE